MRLARPAWSWSGCCTAWACVGEMIAGRCSPGVPGGQGRDRAGGRRRPAWLRRGGELVGVCIPPRRRRCGTCAVREATWSRLHRGAGPAGAFLRCHGAPGGRVDLDSLHAAGAGGVAVGRGGPAPARCAYRAVVGARTAAVTRSGRSWLAGASGCWWTGRSPGWPPTAASPGWARSRWRRGLRLGWGCDRGRVQGVGAGPKRAASGSRVHRGRLPGPATPPACPAGGVGLVLPAPAAVGREIPTAGTAWTQVVTGGWAARQRLWGRFRRLAAPTHPNSVVAAAIANSVVAAAIANSVVAAAIAWELAGFLWPR
jgi:hypothetical protein